MLEVKDLTINIGGRNIVEKINFSVAENEWLMIIGPNGAGKSTIINAISQGTDYSGEILFRGASVAHLKPNDIARKIGILMQNNYVSYSFSIEEIVRLGRYSYSPGIFQSMSDESNEKIEEAMKITGVYPIKEQSVLTLSGGELQRTFLAQLLAQDPELLILDEPTNHLDLVYQKQVFQIIEEWIKTPGRGVISVVHDLSLAKAYGSKALLMTHGKELGYGDIDKVTSAKNLADAYSMDVQGWMHKMLSQWSS